MQVSKGLLMKGETFLTHFSSVVHKYGPVRAPLDCMHVVVPLFQEASWVSIAVKDGKTSRKVARLELNVQGGLLIKQGVAIWPETGELIYDSYRLQVEMPEVE